MFDSNAVVVKEGWRIESLCINLTDSTVFVLQVPRHCAHVSCLDPAAGGLKIFRSVK